jgi:hypothetical protein
MAMTIQQAQMRAMQLRSLKPELQNMAVEDLISQIMATEGMGAPGAGGGGLADIFQPARVLTPSSPAPMEASRLAAPKPTADIVPGAGTDAFRRAQEVRQRTERGPTPDEMAAANAKRQALVDEVRAGAGGSAPAVVAAAPEAAPVAAAEAAPEKPKFQSRFRPQFEQAKAELEQLKATVPAGKEPSPEQASRLRNLSGVVSRLEGMVSAEEGAVVDAERAALLERQAARLGREEELVESARKRAPFDALIAGGAALAGAKPGESFASALSRGLQAGSEKYTGARDAREAALRGIEEKRDAYTLQKIDALQSARDKAIELANAGVQLTKEEYALASLEDADVIAMGTQQARIDEAVARANKAKTEAQYAERVIQSGLDVDQAQISNYLETRGSGGSGGSGGDGEEKLSPTQAFNRAESSRKKLEKLEKRIIEADGKGDVAAVETLLNQYKSDRDAYNENAPKAKLAPITVRGFPVKLPKYEAYVKKNKGRHPSGRTTEQYGAYEAANKYVR